MRTFEVAESSMSPAYRPGDYLMTVALRRPRRGSAVVFPHPHKPIFLLKRIVALPGESIELDSRGLRIEGGEDPGGGFPPTTGDNIWEVPAGHVVVLSDSLDVTMADSRTFGPVPLDGMRRVLFRYRRGHQYP